MCVSNATTYAPLISAGFGLLGVLIGSFIGRINSMSMIKRQEFNKGAATFRAAFVDIIYAIKHSEKITTGDQGWYVMLREIHTDEVDMAHEKAKILFEPFLSDSDLPGFNVAWKNYIEWPVHFQNQDDTKNKKAVILDHIYALLEYATPK